MKIDVRKALTQDDIQKCLNIRKQVFVIGQNVPLNEDIDGKDEVSEHYLLTVDNAPAGVARVRFVEYYAKVERVGVLDEFQGKGLGKLIMKAILSDLEEQGAVVTAKLSSQTHAIPFYEKLGFVVCSEEYMDAGIAHKDMMLNMHE